MSEASAFKNLINKNVVKTIALDISKSYPAFNSKDFIKTVAKLDALELKARVQHISSVLKTYLPKEYKQAIKIICEVIKMDHLSGFALWPFSEYISHYGLDDFETSMQAMYILTQKFTSEFAVRPFFIKDQEVVLRYFNKWATDKNHHIRRWVSEGSRPLLPWGMKLQNFVADPTPTLQLLDKLKYDDELYVRKSVANHLNDISKHHPKKVIETISTWEKNCPTNQSVKIQWIKKQALRTLIKKGDQNALKLMGVKGVAKVNISQLALNKKNIQTGEHLEFSFELSSKSNKPQKLVIDYLIHFVKSNQKLKAKVFKLKTITLESKSKIIIQKKHSMRLITTMDYYPGEHLISIQINGKVLINKTWILQS
jgi:3-methyladenine DNA glycosylase AlkC